MLHATIPSRAETLQILCLINNGQPLLMLGSGEDGYGSRWTLSGEQVQPAIARNLMEAGLVTEIGQTEFGARRLVLTPSGCELRERGIRWWASLGWLEKLRIKLLG